VELLRRLEPQPDLLPASDEIMALITEAAQMGLKLESGEGAQILARILSRYISNLEANFTSASATQLQEFLLLLNSIPITVDLMEAQNSLFALMTEHFPGLAARVARDPEALRLAENLVVLLEALYFSPIRYFKLLA
jgi:hypothetical protein